MREIDKLKKNDVSTISLLSELHSSSGTASPSKEPRKNGSATWGKDATGNNKPGPRFTTYSTCGSIKRVDCGLQLYLCLAKEARRGGVVPTEVRNSRLQGRAKPQHGVAYVSRRCRDSPVLSPRLPVNTSGYIDEP